MGTKYIFRMDDITPDMDWGKFYKFFDMFERNGIRPIIGVVPDNKDPHLSKQPKREDFWEIIKDLQQRKAVDVAQHGFEHKYVVKKTGVFRKIYGYWPQSEFVGLSYEEQYRKIKAGQDILKGHGIISDIWMAPSHSFDKTTMKVLKDLGFKRITDGIALFPYKSKGLLFIPQQLWKSDVMPFKTGIATICLHTNELDDEYFYELEEFIKSGIEVTSFNELKDYKTSFLKDSINVLYKAYFITRRYIHLFKRYILVKIKNVNKVDVIDSGNSE